MEIHIFGTKSPFFARLTLGRIVRVSQRPFFVSQSADESIALVNSRMATLLLFCIRRSHQGEDREMRIQKFGVPDRSTAEPDCQSRCVWRIAVGRGSLHDSQRRERDSWGPLGLEDV